MGWLFEFLAGIVEFAITDRFFPGEQSQKDEGQPQMKSVFKQTLVGLIVFIVLIVGMWGIVAMVKFFGE